jgi:flagellar basal-body rod protein FlgB
MDIQGDRGQLLVKLMAATSLRDRWISNNIANQNVPGYQRRDVRFEELLHEKLARHEPDLLAVQPEVSIDTASPANSEGNNVNLELETTKARENRLMFELYASIFQSRMELIQSAITSSR